MINKIKIRLSILILSLITIIGIMTISINGEVKKIVFKQQGFITDSKDKRVHPTQKPSELMEILINEYTKEDDIILDCFMGSGSTGVACMNTNRKFIGIELDNNYFNIAKQRIEEAYK